MNSIKSTEPGKQRICALLEISELLLQAISDSEPVKKSLHIILTSADGISVALYKRYYTSNVSYYLKQIGSAHEQDSPTPPFPETLRSEKMDAPVWAMLNTDVAECFNECCFDTRFADNNIYIVPLKTNEQACGLLILARYRPDVDGTLEFLSTAGNLFNQWLKTVDATKRLEDVFDSIPNPSFIMTADGNIIYWNKANELMTGWKAEQLIGKGNYESSLPYYGIRRPMVANLIMNEGTDWQSTYYEFEQEKDHVNALAFCPALPGGGAFLRTNTNRLYDLNNRLWGAIHAVRDVTIELQMRENLERSESMYRSIADFAGVGILLVKNEDVIYANEQAEDFLGKASDRICLADLQTWVKLEEDETVGNLMAKLRWGEEKLVRFEFQAVRDGKTAYFNALAQLIPHDNQQVIHFFIDDVTEQKEMDRRVRENELKLIHEERLTSLGIMAAGIAHELNQPLNTIRVVTEGFLYGNEKGWEMDRDELVENIEMISKQISRMSTVINNIRNFSREDKSADFANVSINNAVETVFSMIGRQFEAHNIIVHLKLEENLPAVMAPINQLEQVVTNLLINARQAFDGCPHGQWQICVETGAENNTVFLKIADNATGIPDDLFEKIFYPFFTTKQVGKGTGLGLSICQTILANMNGKLDVFNNQNGGATFIVKIPTQKKSDEYPGN
ncbi:MAG: PAS domain S-box protein [Candidatus Vecturithrix sp.]|jgi:PAS domain S-box-containing protein|nr:PAS domain S-box protein [Candidatus Vecturithrix sp.]